MSADASNICQCCGQPIEGLLLNWHCPHPTFPIPKWQQWYRVKKNADMVTVDKKAFYIHGLLGIPIIGHDDQFVFGVWVSLSAESFKQTVDLWDMRGRETMAEPMFGWLCSNLPTYPKTFHLATTVLTQPVGERPLIEIQPCDHPLAVDQQEGITLEKAHAMIRAISEQ